MEIAADRDSTGLVPLVAALAAGRVSADGFVQQVLDRHTAEPDVIWEVLALLDQHFRRRLLPHDVYTSIKARLQQHALGHGAAAVPVRMELETGELLDERLRVLRILRRDAHSTLVEVVDERKRTLPGVRDHATVLVLHDDVARSPGVLQRIGQLQSLSHPGLVRILDVLTDQDTLLLVMEQWPSCMDLQVFQKQHAAPAPPAYHGKVLREMAAALSWMHARGIAHGALSLENLLIDDAGTVRLAGFALAEADTLSQEADRRAFAAIACQLLSAPGAAPDAGPASHSTLHRPRGLQRAQWLAIRNALRGRETPGRPNVLDVFGGARAGDASGWRAPRRARAITSWLAAGLVGALLVTGIHLYRDASRNTPGAGTAPALPAQSLPPATSPPASRLPPETDVAPIAQAAPPTELPASAEPPAPTARPIAPPRIDLPAAATWADTTDAFARVRVRRSGDLRMAVMFSWWTENGSALAGRDFQAVPRQLETLPAGAQAMDVLVPLLPDATRTEPRTFRVRIAVDDGALPGASTTQVAIVPPGYPAARGREPGPP